MDTTQPEGHPTWSRYQKIKTQEMRSYVPGEDLTAVSVNDEDTPELGGMISRNHDNHDDQWYVSKGFFKENYAVAGD